MKIEIEKKVTEQGHEDSTPTNSKRMLYSCILVCNNRKKKCEKHIIPPRINNPLC